MFSNNICDKIQEKFLNVITKNKSSMTIFLSNGIKLQGKITNFDNSSLVLEKNGRSQLIYKNSIASLFPEEDINI